ncbi:hypothetical protein PGIGA_G00030610 [Pangasianodon gigas]|uniref:Uncharacterized protein n=1 Tax=Pangasianodon gigas TaxID=30993 RepID=A0ACC5WYH7_PANGG|nr:hypothetical protein [Pangasianodon gigas]
MDYLLNRNFLLLLTVGAIINPRVQGTFSKPVVPRMVEACVGAHTTISCTFPTEAKGLKVRWCFGKTSDFNECKKIELHSSNGSSVSHYHEDKEMTASHLTIRNVTFSDSGWYFCEVTQDIPQLIKNHSNGSELVIYSPTESNLEVNTTYLNTTCDSETPNASPWWLWVALAMGSALSVTTVIITMVICRRNKDSPVYENTKEASKRRWKEDQSLHLCMPSKGYSNKQTDTLKPHNNEYHPKGRQMSPRL